MIKKMFLVLTPVIVALFTAGCIEVKIQKDTDYPKDIFKQKAAEIDILTKQSRDYSAKNLHIMVYNGKNREFVQCGVPLSLLDMVLEAKGGFKGKKVWEKHGDYLDFNWKSLKKLSTLGPGLLIEVEEKEENTHLLIWME